MHIVRGNVRRRLVTSTRDLRARYRDRIPTRGCDERIRGRYHVPAAIGYVYDSLGALFNVSSGHAVRHFVHPVCAAYTPYVAAYTPYVAAYALRCFVHALRCFVHALRCFVHPVCRCVHALRCFVYAVRRCLQSV